MKPSFLNLFRKKFTRDRVALRFQIHAADVAKGELLSLTDLALPVPVNSAKRVAGGAKNYGRDGAMPVDAPNGRVKNYEPNSFDGPVQTNQELYAGFNMSDTSGHYPQVPRQVDDFKQPGDLYRLMPKDAQQRLVDNIAGSLAQVSRAEIIARSLEHFRRADAELGRRIAEGIAAQRGKALV